ncbi:ABC transporter substrate-binding protein [Desulfovibrio gilichinskyi]|uniref:Putative ABC transport system substrate-binding protein n=1 Tax=Desulfovibrio gilichinskyi TaxID=1519643 RepID=A0A1X7C7R7_9BACT|nr:ABC transporter substrate-binding protein [Desulfovibrio gilichinskyi]SME91604.1 putative ABC transport system substrate-binding protein [Desulfovibrio gilichinskyi]
MKKILLFMVILFMVAVPVIHSAQSYTVSITQIVEHPSLDAMRAGFQSRMKEAGINVQYNVHIAQGNQANNIQIANQIKGENPSLILAITTPSAQAVAQKIKDKPILFTGVTDPVAAGLVRSLMIPGKNITGMTDMSPIVRQVELIKEFLPDVKTIGTIYNAGEANSVVLIKILKDVCKDLGIKVEEASIANSSGVYQAAKSLVGKCDAIYIPLDNTVVSGLEAAIKVCRQNKLPIFSADTDSVKRGTIAAVAIDYYRMGLQTADMAIRILNKKAIPASTPVESLENLQLYVNPAAAETMGVTIPKQVLDRADNIIK